MNGRLLALVAAVALNVTLTAGQTPAVANGNSGAEPCSRSPLCGWGRARNVITHETRTPNLGFTYAYPFAIPADLTGGVAAVALNSKEHLFAFQRNPAGKPQLLEFDQNHRFVRAIGEDVIGHANKAHGMAIDAQDNIWICDENGDTVLKISPDGKLLMTLGVPGQRGDWDEAKGQRLLWQPLHLAFAGNGDIYIGEGHANESPNDTDKSPSNKSGAARILHLDRNGKFINQWSGNNAGQGHFSMVHGIAVNPDNGNVYIGDREEYRIVVYDEGGKFIKTIQMRNLVCALYVDSRKQLWMATGQDGQIFKIDWDGNVLGAIGNGPGRGEGQFVEASYLVMDSRGHLFTGDTSVARITEMVPPAQTASAAPAPPQPSPTAPLYQRTGEQYRIYNFPGTGESIPYRLFVPARWTPGTRLPMLVTLRAGNTVDGPYRAQNDLVRVAAERGYIVVTPMGYRGLSQPYYGSRYQIARPGAAAPAAGWTEQEDQRAEQDVLYVMDLVAKEYNVDLSRVHLHGQNPSGSGALYLAQKYPERFASAVVSSAPIVYDAYPFDRLKGKLALLVIHGDQDTVNPIAASQKMADAAKAAGVETVYATVPGGTHLEAYLTYARQIFAFLDAHKK